MKMLKTGPCYVDVSEHILILGDEDYSKLVKDFGVFRTLGIYEGGDIIYLDFYIGSTDSGLAFSNTREYINKNIVPVDQVFNLSKNEIRIWLTHDQKETYSEEKSLKEVFKETKEKLENLNDKIEEEQRYYDDCVLFGKKIKMMQKGLMDGGLSKEEATSVILKILESDAQ